MPKKVNRTKPHYKVVKFYRRNQEPATTTLAAALAIAQSGEGEYYAQVWKMENETDGEAVAFFENAVPANVIPAQLQSS